MHPKLKEISILLVLLFAVAVFSLMTSAQAQKFVLRVNAGDFANYKDKAGNVWQGDKDYIKGKGYGFVGGQSVDRGAEMKIEGTVDPHIYQTEHYQMDAFVAEVPNGKYTVRLHFAETYENIDQDGPRVFNVTVQKKAVLSDFDLQNAASGAQKALVKEFKGIDVTDGVLEIGFVAKQQQPEINGIEILGE